MIVQLRNNTREFYFQAFNAKMWVSLLKSGSSSILKAQIRLSNIWNRPGCIAYLTTEGQDAEYKPIKSILVANRGKQIIFYN